MNKINPEQQDGWKQHVHSRQDVELHRALVFEAISYQGPPIPVRSVAGAQRFTLSCYVAGCNFLMGAISRDPSIMLQVNWCGCCELFAAFMTWKIC